MREQMDMSKITIIAMAAAVIVASPVLADESPTALGEGEAIMISPSGTVHKSDSKVSGPKHDAAVAQGAEEVSGGTMFYKHEGKLYSMKCVGSYIGAWEQGYPGTENLC
jgi:hypothetical protein